MSRLKKVASKGLTIQVVQELVTNAANEIGIQYDEGMVDQVLNQLKSGYGIELDDDGPLTTEFLITLCNEVDEWKKNTKDM